MKDFLRYCEVERGLAELTCHAYRRDVGACVRFMASIGIERIEDVRVVHLRRFLEDETRTRPAIGSRTRTVVAIRSFFRFCVENEYLVKNPAISLRTPKKREALPDVLDQRELTRLLHMPTADGVWQRTYDGRAERDRLMLALLAFSGLRRSELLGLDIDDVDLGTMLLRVRRAKGGRHRTIPIHPALVPLFDAYLPTRLPIEIDRALFLGRHGRRLTTTVLASTFRRYAAAAGVDKHKRVTPHTLRHVFATELLAAGANLRQIQELLGHKHLDSTQHYTRVNAHQLRGAVKRLRWREGSATQDH